MDALYKKFYRPILKFVGMRIGDRNVAEELTQEVFLKAHRYRDSYDEKYAFSTWLWTIARNTVYDYLRGARFGADDGFSSPIMVGDAELSLDDLPSSWQNAEALLIKQDQRRSILKLIGRLSRLQKRVLWLRVIHQLSYEEIARRLGLSLSAVKNLVYRAKITLADAYRSPLPQM